MWIGWELDFHTRAFSVLQEKRDRLQSPVAAMLQHSARVHRRDLHKVTGVIQWLWQVFPMARA